MSHFSYNRGGLTGHRLLSATATAVDVNIFSMYVCVGGLATEIHGIFLLSDSEN